MPETGPDNSESAIERRADAVISDLHAGRVVPRKIDEISEAVMRARMDGALRRSLSGRL
jgi:hypothetical protein